MTRTETGDNGCYGALIDGEAALERARRVIAAGEVVDSYARTHERVVAAGERDPDCRAGLSAALADRAFAAEDAVRSLIGDHLDALNELRDGGGMATMLDEGAKAFEAHGFDWHQMLKEAGREAEDSLGIDPSVLERAAQRIDDYGFGLSSGGDGTVQASIATVHGKQQSFAVRGAAQPGDPARVSRAELLGAAGIRPSVPTLVPSDCHHRGEPLLHGHHEAIDLYGVNVAGLAYARETSYRHARTIAELGPSAFRGSDPGTWIVVGIVVVGVIVAGVGVAMVASGDPRGWGLIAFGGILIVGGICVAVGACGFALTPLLHIVV